RSALRWRDIAPGAQTERRGGAGPGGACLAVRAPPAALSLGARTSRSNEQNQRSRARTSLSLAARKSFRPSSVVAAKIVPSGENATTQNGHPWRSAAVRTAFRFPVATSHSLAVWSQLPAEARALPSGEKATEMTGLPCPLKVLFSLPVSASQSLIA